ncbi:MAG: hypothetical protein ACFB9M_05300 [Myxococcota bacterium]
MNAPRWILPGLLSLAQVSCGSDEVSLGQRTSALCPGIIGMEAIAWDYYNGLLVTDATVLPPPIPPPGGTFTHTDFPLLGFIYPPGWTPEELRGFGTTGVNLLRNDAGAIWRYASFTANGTADVRIVRDQELNRAIEFFGAVGPFQTVCINEGTVEQAPGTGIVSSFSNILVRDPDRTMLATASVTTVPGLLQSSIFVRLISSASREFPERLLDTFMAIDWQMLLGERVSSDRDGDGWLDQFDRAPDDPNVH